MRLKSSYELLQNVEKFLVSFEEEVRRAKSSIDLQFYTFEADTVGKRAVKILFEAKKRGIRIRFLQDHFIDLFHNDRSIRRPRLNRRLHRSVVNEWNETKKLLAEMEKKGIEIKRTNPLGLFFRKALQRDHKKMVIIDSELPSKSVAYIGGINLCEHNALWNDFMVKMTGDMVSIIQEDFNLTWEDKNIGKITKYSDGIVLTDSRKSPQIMPYLTNLIDHAEKSVIVESPYLYGKEIKQNLIDAAQKGVDVSVIVPLHNNKRFFAPSGRFLKKLIRGGAHVYSFEKNGGMTHAKAMLIDNAAVFGSSNFNEFLSGRICEINIATENEDMVRQLRKKLESDMQVSQKQS
ncbi:MAG: hypothetical protein HW400_522 [Candidatus Levybacteria bacterium]|nr:hypothetical protein [Candidatus Levybacteria bacterium]